jgi:hypothetical protein
LRDGGKRPGRFRIRIVPDIPLFAPPIALVRIVEAKMKNIFLLVHDDEGNRRWPALKSGKLVDASKRIGSCDGT